MERAVLCALVAATLSTAASATTTTISGSFTARDWSIYIDGPAAMPDAVFLSYSATFDSTQTYDNASGPLVTTSGIAAALGFSFNPDTRRMILATQGSPNGCSHPAGSFCAIIDDFLANEPWLVVVTSDDGTAWRASTIVPGDGLVSPPGVPEPANWAMMIAGFGLVGAVRRQRRLVPA
jgi:hypothetical protein